MEPEQGLQRVAALPEDTGRVLGAAGWRVFVLPRGILDQATFFAAVRETLPLDPPVRTDRSWDALADSLWEGLHRLDGNKIAIIWPDAARMASSDPGAFDTATAVLADTAHLLADDDATLGNPKRLAVLVA